VDAEKFHSVEVIQQHPVQYKKKLAAGRVAQCFQSISYRSNFSLKISSMKKIMMTACGVAFMSMMALAQNVDSTLNQNGSTDFRNNPIQDSAMTQPVNPQPVDPQPIEGTPRTQDPTTSPIIQQQQQQQQPQIQTQPQLQSEPQQLEQQQLESPLQPQTQPPTQDQPTLDRNSTPQLNQPTQPTQPAPTPTDPTGGGTPPR
jgi:hypothetical protein